MLEGDVLRLCLKRTVWVQSCTLTTLKSFLNSFIHSVFLIFGKMSGNAQISGFFAVADYVVFALMLVVSTAVGVYFAWASRGKESSRDFLTGGRKLTALPVSMSLTASFMSSTTLLSNPPEVRWCSASFSSSRVIWFLLVDLTAVSFVDWGFYLHIHIY